MGTLREYQCTFSIISRSVLLRMKNVSDKIRRGTQNTHFIFCNLVFSANCVVNEIKRKNMTHTLCMSGN